MLQSKKCGTERVKGVGVTLGLNSRLKGYVSRQCLWTVRWGNGHARNMPLEVFTQRNSVADFIRLKLNFISKNRLLSHRLGEGQCTHYISLESSLSTSYSSQLNFFRYRLRLRRYKRKKPAFFEGGGPLSAHISDGGERRLPTTVGVRKLE